MAHTVSMTHTYNAPVDAVWRVATDWASFSEAMKGLATFHGLPTEPIATGQKIQVAVSLFGFMPKMPWVMEIAECDPQAGVLQSHEHGGVVRRWDHRLTVEPSNEGAILRDEIIIDAGALTFLYATWARFMYARRHVPRLRMLGLTS